MTPPRKTEPMDSTSVAELRTAIRHRVQHSRDNRFLYRLFCVLLVAEGHGPQTVADWMGEHARTLERWRKRFQLNGVDGLFDETSPGRPPKLSAEQVTGVADDLAQPPYVFGFGADQWQGKYLKDHLRRRFDIDISLRQCQRLLKQLKALPKPSDIAEGTSAPIEAELANDELETA